MSEQFFWELVKTWGTVIIIFCFLLATAILITDFSRETSLWAILVASGFVLLFLKEK